MNLQIPIVQMKEEGNWPLSWTSAIGLIPILRELGNEITGCEIGTSYGFNLVYFLDNLPNLKKVYAIDPYLPYDDGPGGLVTEDIINKVRELFLVNTEPYKPKVEFINTTANDAVDRIADNSLDYIFIDGDHSYNSVINDMENYYSKVKSGGIFSGHDYHLKDVTEAVGNFRLKNKIYPPVQMVPNSVWFWRKP